MERLDLLLAIDFDFQNHTLNNEWISYRTKKDRSLSLKAEHLYEHPAKFNIFVKVVKLFGVDTSQVYGVGGESIRRKS